ncbi:MAG: trimeric intracellular cation channel family protein [Bacteroidota bacterium]
MTAISYTTIIEILGIITFTVSGTLAAMDKKLDVFGIIIIGFVTAIGGGTIRDILIGSTPVAWMRDITTLLVILGTGMLSIFFKPIFHSLQRTLLVFDALGLGLFTIIGINKGLAAGLHPGICVALGTITACFGGVLRDLLLKDIPALFHTKEIYATACIIGGATYVVCLPYLDQRWCELVAIIFISGFRLLALKLNWRLPNTQ